MKRSSPKLVGNAEENNNNDEKSYGSLSKYVKNLYKLFERICKSHFR